MCPRQAAPRVGGADSPGRRCCSVSAAEKVCGTRGTVTGNVSEADELTTPTAARPGNEPNSDVGARRRTGRLGEMSGAAASDGPTVEDDSEVQCNLKTLNEQQRATLWKNGKQLFVDEVDQLTTNEAGHTDLAGICNVGQSELLSTCKLAGRRNTANLTRYRM